MKKKLVILVSVLFSFFIIGIIVYMLLPNKVAVLGYHSITLEENSNNDMQININKFEEQMKYLKRYHYKSLTLDEMKCYMQKKCKIKKNTVLITFDDGYLDNYEYAFPILKKYGFNAVVFIIGKTTFTNGESGYLKKDDIEKIKKEYPNVELASHSYNLHYMDAINLSYEDYINDMKQQSKFLNTKYYAYPYGNNNDDMVKALKNQKYEMAFGFGPDFRKASNKDDIFLVPRLSISGSMPMWKFKLRLFMPF